MRKTVVLMILDGWGLGENSESNAIMKAETPNMDKLLADYPHGRLVCFGEEVGLPAGQQGNSEVGHLTLGAGRIIDQDLTKINKAVAKGSIEQNEAFTTVMNGCIERKRPLHLMGLLSPGGVHSHMDHILALVKMAKEKGVEAVYIHAFLDGRDVGPKTAASFLKAFESQLAEVGLGEIASVSGRYYAMDRDNRWERVQKAYEAMVFGVGEKAYSALEAVEKSDKTDEFVLPTVICRSTEQPVAVIEDGDGVIFCNFRADRAREISRAFVDIQAVPFQTKAMNIDFGVMTQYYDGINAKIAYPPLDIAHTLGQVLSAHHLKQLRIAETEKYAHVTFFFNGGKEEPTDGEDRILVPSPKVATYDLQPAMSAPLVTEKLLSAIESGQYDFILINYANPDMVGHTGNFAATVEAVAAVDDLLGKVVQKVLEKSGAIFITADHGNAEKMLDKVKNTPHTAHTSNEVPFVLVTDKALTVHNGALQDVAPTILQLLGLEQPVEMTGQSLID